MTTTVLYSSYKIWQKSCIASGIDGYRNAYELKNIYELDLIYNKFIINNYRDDNRYYHNINHINQCFNQYDIIVEKIPISCPEEIMMAIWFHDVIYDPRRSDNELKSANLADLCLSRYISRNAVSRIANMILLSGQHSQIIEENLSIDKQVFLDIDLSILGQAPEIYDAYSENVRKEYSFIDDDIFYVKRKEILENFLKKKNIYHTQYFIETIGSQAIKNIKREIYSIK